MPASQLSLPGLSPIENRGLFANHFLEKRLPLLSAWNSDTDDLNRVFTKLKKLYNEKGATMSDATNEAQTEDDFVKPVLNALWTRDCYQIQVNLPNPDGRGQPDYALFTTQAARDEAEPLKGGLSYWNGVAVVGDAKKWRDSLDKARKGETPGAQISRYLFQTNRRWAILSNGPIWRLYEQDRARTGGVFYEVNLEHILQSGSLEDFKHFYFFFRREAFTPDSSGQSFIEQIFKGSADYATQVGAGLKESVYDALRHLMNGFFDHTANNLDRHDTAQLQRVHDTSLIVLYRLLFILFAEDRGLLPCNDFHYKPISLREMHREINARLRQGTTYLTSTNALWPRVCDLCNLIDKGLEVGARTVIPAYNGGLFSAANHPDIAPEEGSSRRWRIGDEALAETIDRLAYARTRWNEPGREDIDYSSLEVQNLGSIYEGLLELQPLVATGDLIEVRESGKTIWKPKSDVPVPRNISGQTPRLLSVNEIYLATDKGERKASGSYYTPKYIVDYIVENTVGPLANGAAQKVASLWHESKSEHERLHALLVSGDEDVRTSLETLERALLAPYLELRILDPAMGSGHFLVGAADYLSFAMATDPSLPALAMMGDEDAQAFYKRLAVEHCLYGVDLNPLAVELAKLSLWLHTVSKSRALSFLDHHLHTGNSLIGASLDRDLNHEPPRLDAGGRVRMLSTLFIPNTQVLNREQLAYLLGVFEQIAGVSGGDASDEHAKDALYRTMDAVRNRYRSLANLWLAPFFGVAVSADFYQRAVQTLSADEATWNSLTTEPTWCAAQEIAVQKRFFHWHLEFPEAFLNADGLKPEAERGFDAVIGNPPYINATELNRVLSAHEKPYWKTRFISAEGAYDLYILFMEQMAQLTRSNRLYAAITPNKFLSAPYAVAFRKHFCTSSKLITLLNLSRVKVFDDPSVYPMVLVAENQNNAEDYQIRVETPEAKNSPDSVQVVIQESANLIKLPEHIWGFLTSEHLELMLKAEHISERLNDCACVRASSTAGEADGYSESGALMNGVGANCVRFINTGLIDRYSTTWGLDSLTQRGVRFLQPHLDLANSAVSNGRCEQYIKPKIAFAKMAKQIEAFWDTEGIYASANTNFVYDSKYDLGYLTAIVNSRLMSVLYGGYFGALIMSGGYFQFQAPQLKVLPIRRVEFLTPADERTGALQEAQTLYTGAMKSGDASTLLDWVDAALEHEQSRADCVHDLLAFLAGEMMRLNTAKHTEKNGFFEWLESFVGASIEALTNKTRVRAFEEADFEAFLAVLSANRARLTKDPQAREPRTSLKEEWAASTTKLAPLQLALARTDELIDAVVYKLYGLSKDEIAVVRGEVPISSAPL